MNQRSRTGNSANLLRRCSVSLERPSARFLDVPLSQIDSSTPKIITDYRSLKKYPDNKQKLFRGNAHQMTSKADNFNIMTQSFTDHNTMSRRSTLSNEIAMELFKEYINSLRDFSKLLKLGRRTENKGTSTSPVYSDNSISGRFAMNNEKHFRPLTNGKNNILPFEYIGNGCSPSNIPETSDPKLNAENELDRQYLHDSMASNKYNQSFNSRNPKSVTTEKQ